MITGYDKILGIFNSRNIRLLFSTERCLPKYDILCKDGECLSGQILTIFISNNDFVNFVYRNDFFC